MFQICLLVPVGAINETSKISGISHFLEHVLFSNKGSLIKNLSSIGSNYNAMTTSDMTMFYINTIPENYIYAIECIYKLTQYITLSSLDIIKEHKIILEEKNLRDGKSISFNLVMKCILDKTNPYNKSLIGTERSLKNINITSLRNYYKTMYTQGILVINTDVKISKKAQIYIKKKFNIDNSLYFFNEILKKKSTLFKPKIILGYTPSQKYNTKLVFAGFPGYFLKENIIVEFISYILTSSSLYSLFEKELRQKRQMIYTISSYNIVSKYCSMFIISFSSMYYDNLLIISILLNLLDKLKTNGLSETKFNFYKSSYLNNIKEKLVSTPDSQTTMYINTLYYNNKGLTLSMLLKYIKKITNKDIIQTCKTLFDFNKLGVLSTGKYHQIDHSAKSIKDIIKSY